MLLSREELQERTKVQQAFLDGGSIQCCCNSEGRWYDIDNPTFTWHTCNYRVKVEPLTLYCTVYDEGTKALSTGGLYLTKQDAETWLNSGGRVAKFVEVVEESDDGC